jgi:hypothetical protein
MKMKCMVAIEEAVLVIEEAETEAVIEEAEADKEEEEDRFDSLRV